MIFGSLFNKINHLRTHQGFIKYFRNTSWLLIDKILRILATIFVGAWVARFLGPENYGLLTYSNSVIMMFVPIAMFGLNDVTVKELIKNRYTKSEILGTAFTIKLIGGAVAFFLVLIYLAISNQEIRTVYLILLFSPYLLLQSFDVIDFFFQSKVRSKYVVYSRIIALIISNAIKIVFIITQADLIFFAIAMIAELFIVAMINIYFYHLNHFKLLSWRFRKDLGLKFIKKSWPLLLSGLMYIIYIRVDQIMVKEILGNSQAGLYAVAIGLCEAWYFLPQVFAASFFPAILLAKQKSNDLYVSRLTKLYFMLFWIAVLIALLTTVFGEYIITLLYGADFMDSYTILKLYIWSNIFYFYATISSKWLVAENLYLHAFYRNVVGAVLNIALNAVFLKNYGLEGAAMSTLISYGVVGLFYDLINKKLRVNFIIKLKAILCIS